MYDGRPGDEEDDNFDPDIPEDTSSTEDDDDDDGFVEEEDDEFEVDTDVEVG